MNERDIILFYFFCYLSDLNAGLYVVVRYQNIFAVVRVPEFFKFFTEGFWKEIKVATDNVF